MSIRCNLIQRISHLYPLLNDVLWSNYPRKTKLLHFFFYFSFFGKQWVTMEKANTSLVRTKSDQLLELMVAGLKSPPSSDHSANGVVDSRKSSRWLTGATPGRGGKNTHIRKSRSAQISQMKLELDDVSSGAALSRASSASLGLSFSFTGFTMPPEEIADSKPFSDDDIRKYMTI